MSAPSRRTYERILPEAVPTFGEVLLRPWQAEGRRPLSSYDDPESEHHGQSTIPRRITILIPVLVGAGEYEPPRYAVGRLNLTGAAEIAEFVDALKMLREWVAEPYEGTAP